MEYIVFPTKSKSETAFFRNLLKKMQKNVSTVSSDELADLAFMRAMKEAEKGPKGRLSKVKAHLEKIAKG